MQHSMPLTASLCADDESGLAYVASVSVGFSSRSRHLLLFRDAKIGASATLMEKKSNNASNNATETLATSA